MHKGMFAHPTLQILAQLIYFQIAHMYYGYNVTRIVANSFSTKSKDVDLNPPAVLKIHFRIDHCKILRVVEKQLEVVILKLSTILKQHFTCTEIGRAHV